MTTWTHRWIRLGLWGWILGMAFVLTRASMAQGTTTIRITVLDAQNLPVAGLLLDVHDAHARSFPATTDAAGVALVGPLDASARFVQIVRATCADGRLLTIEPTTLDALQLALLPGYERPVLLQVRTDDVLAVNPETLFAGVDAAGAPNPLVVPTPLITPTPSAVPSVHAGAQLPAATQAPAASSSPVLADTAPPYWLWAGLIGLGMLVVVGVRMRRRP